MPPSIYLYILIVQIGHVGNKLNTYTYKKSNTRFEIEIQNINSLTIRNT